MCAHIPSINNFKGIKNILNQKSIFIFEVSYLGDVYKNDFLYNVSWACFISCFKTAYKIFQKYNLEIFDLLVEAQEDQLEFMCLKKDHN